MHSNLIKSSTSYHFKLIDGLFVNKKFNSILILFLISIQSSVINCLDVSKHSTSFINDQLELVQHGPQYIPAAKNDPFINSFHVHLHDHHKDNGEEIAKNLAKRHGFTNLGKVCNFCESF